MKIASKRSRDVIHDSLNNSSQVDINLDTLGDDDCNAEIGQVLNQEEFEYFFTPSDDSDTNGFILPVQQPPCN